MTIARNQLLQMEKLTLETTSLVVSQSTTGTQVMLQCKQSLSVTLRDKNAQDLPQIMGQIMATSKGLTPLKALAPENKQLSVHKAENEELLECVVIILITKLSDSVHSSIRMTPEQIQVCAEDILDDYWMLKLEEVVYVLNNARKRKNYNSLDQSVIFDSFDTYVKNNRQAAVEANRVLEYQKNEEDKQAEIQAVKAYYDRVKAGEERLLVNVLSDVKKEQKTKEAQFKAYKAMYLANKLAQDKLEEEYKGYVESNSSPELNDRLLTFEDFVSLKK